MWYKWLVGILVVIVISIVVKFVFFPIHVIDKSLQTSYDVTSKTMNAENAIYNYEWFKSQEAYIRECLKNEEIAHEEWSNFLSMLPEDRSTWDRDDKQEEGSLRGSYYALQKLTNKAIEDYNAKSSMVNRSVFKDNLPVNIVRSVKTGLEFIRSES